jgi:hypothetical protein
VRSNHLSTVVPAFEPEANYDGDRYAPMVRPDERDWAQVDHRWQEYGFRRD